MALLLAAAACSNSGDNNATTGSGSSESSSSSGSATTSGSVVPITGVPGVTDTEIKYSVIGTRSNNPLGTCILDCFLAGIKAYFAFRNSQGGAYGRQLTVAPELDDELTSNQQRSLEVVSNNNTFGTFDATLFASGYGDLAQAGIPTYTWAINFDEMSGRDSIYGNSGVACVTCTSRGAAYAPTIVGAKKIAALGYGITQNSKDCVAAAKASIEKYSAQTGEQVAFVDDNLEFGLPNGIAPQVTAMHDAGVDFIETCIDLNGMKTLAQELERQGMGDVPMLHPNTYNAKFVADAGALFNGDIVAVQFRPFEADAGKSTLNDFREWMQKAGSDLSELAMQGWINADLAYQGLLAAGPQFDRAKVVAATNQMKSYSAGGLLVPIDWSRQHVAPTEDDPVTHGYKNECVSYVKVVDGKFQMVGDKSKPFTCWDGTNEDWGEPTPTDFS